MEQKQDISKEGIGDMFWMVKKAEKGSRLIKAKSYRSESKVFGGTMRGAPEGFMEWD